MSTAQPPLRFTGAGFGVLFTDRSHGNMSSVGGSGCEQGGEARERLRRELGLERIARGYQVHGSTIERVPPPPVPAGRTPEQPEVDADGQATNIPGIGAMVLAADCLPVALAGEQAVVMLHAGWRGLAGGVLEAGIESFRELDQAGPITAVLGPCAGACCYEVGPEVHAALGSTEPSQGLIDLREIASARLERGGVVELQRLGGCTICDKRFFSHRREGASAGRQAGIAWLS